LQASIRADFSTSGNSLAKAAATGAAAVANDVTFALILQVGIHPEYPVIPGIIPVIT